MQYVGRLYVPYVNHKYGFSGSIWEGRFKSNLIESERYLFSCMRYIELNPVRANIVSSPEDYLYSNYHVNALGLDGLIVSPHILFTQLSRDKGKQHEFYRLLFGDAISQNDLNEVRLGCTSGTPIGSSCFKKTIESVEGRKIGHLSKGRPFRDSY